MRGLTGKRVLITGGGSGIGAATAARFLEEGSAVCVLDRDAKGRKQIQRQLPGLAGTVDADVSNLQQVQAAFADAVRVLGGVDVVINNAGISIRHNFLDITPEEWEGVIELTRSMALELAPKIRVCAVAPGYVLTPMQRAEYTDEMLDEVNRKIPLRRHAKPEEIAALFAFFASDDAAYMTGHVYTIDGGETAGSLAGR